MKPAWDKLMNKYKGHASVLIASVDCTASGKELCETKGVEGFPTIRYGNPDELEEYDGGRDYATLETFAEDNLKPMCSPSNLDLCDDEKKKQIEELSALGVETLDERISEKEEELKSHTTHFASEVEKLQSRYQELQTELKNKQSEIKKSGLQAMKAVRAANKLKSDAEEHAQEMLSEEF